MTTALQVIAAGMSVLFVIGAIGDPVKDTKGLYGFLSVLFMVIAFVLPRVLA